ncbi:MAG: 2-C-methyl-D-erythritol 4-phosphate cytidylyltransferase [Burkholderiaceae bacterium]|jgi:2-C-methyl-D-erythritol 4-phosphate cytidylyltransferase|nr:2-C-methyl-D-erythritol 4-phosphate cytidylyltransferase [Burkholderiaceae bacterium]
MPSAARCHALLPCAGSGSRAGLSIPKQYQRIAGEPLVQHTLRALGAVARIERILVVLAPQDDHAWPPLPPRVELARVGGATRAESVLNGLCRLLAHGAQPQDWVLVHDAARCLITPALIDTLIDACLPDPVGGLLALPCSDTIKTEGRDPQGQSTGRIATTLPRGGQWLAQTPQMFCLGALHDTLQRQAAHGFTGITDEASAIERAGGQPLLVRGSAQNFKVTWPEDLALAEAVLQSRQASP